MKKGQLLDYSDFNQMQVDLNHCREADRHFPFKAPAHYMEAIDPTDPDDPLLRQILPTIEELSNVEGFNNDPVGDIDASRGNGIIHKYRNRVLIITTQACAIHCRFCFRRNFPYSEQQLHKSQWQEVLEYIKADTELNEVILSGGDPMTLGLEQLKSMVEALDQIVHLKTLRFHTRSAIVDPQCISDEFISWLDEIRLNVVIVVHCNHPNEITEKVANALKRLASTKAQLLNQSVLLRGVNDSATLLADLYHRLFELKVLPYYLHLLDRAQGTAHFEVDSNQVRLIVMELQQKLPGYLIPKVVRDLKGADSKRPVMIGNEVIF